MAHMVPACETLAHGTQVTVSAVHKFGADALLLAAFAQVKRAQRVCDLGTGCGIIPLRLHDRGHRGPCDAVDLAQDALALLMDSLTAQKDAAAHIQPVCADLRTWRSPAEGLYDVVTCNPPYFTGGYRSPDAARATARHADTCTMEDVARCAALLLRDGGRLCLCQRPERAADVLCALRAAHIEPKRLRFVAARAETAPWLMLVEGQKNRAPGMTVLPVLYTENPDGTRPSPELRAIYER